MFQRILERMTMKLTGLALSPVKFMFQWNTERMTMVLTALAPSLPIFQVVVPQVPVYVSSALQEEDLRATGWNPMVHQNRCTRYGLIQLCGSLQGRVRFFQPVHRPQ